MFEKLKKILRNKNYKTILENFFSLAALQLVGMILPLLTLPYVLRILGFDYYGKIVFATSLITYFTSLTDFSFKYTATREVAIFRNSQKKLSLIYSKVLTIKFIFLFISILIISSIVYSYQPFYENRLLYFLTIPMLLGNVFFPDWFFQGIEKMKYITFLNIGIKLIFTVGVFIFINEKSDYWIYPLLQSSGFLFAGLISQIILVKKFKLKFFFLKSRVITRTIKENTPIFINQFLPTLYNNSSTFLLGLFTNNKLVGIYNSIKIIVNLCVTLIEIISRVFFPYLNRKKHAFLKYKKMMFYVSRFLTIVCIGSYKLVFWYLNVNDSNAFVILLILALGIVGYSLYNIFGINYFIINRQDKLV
ncbi:oligosaccharide flippase family protein, partial [Dokdonia donghaensis]|uniref:oligosaccharide flippase family protein n=1 Tax=Dokdonia donghaensis TaxID=326320 RepID=UPI0035C856D8